MKVFVLTFEHNDYDQHGEYFFAVFANKPTREQLLACQISEADVEHVLSGGGRQGIEDLWFNLREEECQ